MQRRQFLAVLPLASVPLLSAHADEPVVKAPKIIEALRAKDIVVDRPGAPAQPFVPPASIDLQVQFAFGSARLLPVGKRQLDELAMALSDRELLSASFELAGHTDAVGSHNDNLRLSMQRAEAVKSYLVQSHGIPTARLFPIGLGFTRLADPARPEAAINRRVEVRRLAGAPAAERPSGGRIVSTPR
jgi:outer membrane protein OmpA-like peptidoglycan-associated protein